MFGSSNDKESLQKKYNQLMEESYQVVSLESEEE